MTLKTVQSTRARTGALTQAGAIREARAFRIRTIRRRVLAGALSLFVATWLLITLMLVSSHDPALVARSSSTKTSSTQAATTSTGNSGATTTTSGSTAAGASGVTTRQS